MVVYTGGFSPQDSASRGDALSSPPASSCPAFPMRCSSGRSSAAATVFLLTRTTFGRAVYAIGNRERAAYLSGVDTRRVVMIAFAISGGLAAFGGVLLAGYAIEGAQAMGDPYLLPSIAAVVLGGTSILGGRGTYLGTVAGVILITLLQSILSVVQPQYMLADLGLKVPPESIRQIVFGLVIVAMMLLYGRERRAGDGNGDGRRRGCASPAARHRRNGSERIRQDSGRLGACRRARRALRRGRPLPSACQRRADVGRHAVARRGPLGMARRDRRRDRRAPRLTARRGGRPAPH